MYDLQIVSDPKGRKGQKMIPVVTTSQMTKAELNSEKNGVTRVRLMQNAANAILNFLVSRFTLSGKSIIIIVGSGNSGGERHAQHRHVKHLP